MTVQNTILIDSRPPRSAQSSLTRLTGWAIVLAILAWSWEGADMRPMDLIKDSGNMATLAGDFFPPNFSEWRLYLDEIIVTFHLAVWGTFLAVICAVPFGILSSENIAPWWIYQPVRRIMDACRAINEVVFAMLFVVSVGLGPLPECWRSGCIPPACWPNFSPRRWKPSTPSPWKAFARRARP